ncbi:MAG: multidrug effflux MFS transporter [Pseudomonadota bacterium]
MTGAEFLKRDTPPVLLTLVMMTGASVLVLNAFIPSLPTIAEEFGAEYAFIQLAVPGYLAATALIQLIIGPLSDRYGRRPILLFGFAWFIAASIGCAVAPDEDVFMMFRMLQCTSAAGMVLSRTIVRDVLPEDEAASMIGYMAAAMAIVPTLAPLYGGAMEEFFGWRATFWSYAVIGVGLVALIWMDAGETNQNKTASFAAQFRAYPDLLRARRFWGYTLTAGFAAGSFFALLGGGPFVAREIYGLSPQMTGVAIGFISVGYLMGNLVTGRLARRLGVNRMMMIGCASATTGMGVATLLVFLGYQSPYIVFGFPFFIGFGNGMTMPTATTGLISVRPKLAGSASGLGGSLMIGFGAALSAATGALITVESGPLPLTAMMWLSALVSLFAAVYVIRRAKAVGAE